MTPPEALLLDLDSLWPGGGISRMRLRILGSMALMLQSDYERGTKDGDILFTPPIDDEIRKRLLNLGGQGSALARRHRVFLDVVSRGILMLPAQPQYVPLPELTARLVHFEVEVLSIPDVVITKLNPFRPANARTSRP